MDLQPFVADEEPKDGARGLSGAQTLVRGLELIGAVAPAGSARKNASKR